MIFKAIIFITFGFMNQQPNHSTYHKQFPTFLKQPAMAAQTQDTLTIEQYGQKIADLFYEGNWEKIKEEIHAVNLPEGWEAQVKPLFESSFGIKFDINIISREEMPQYLLNMLQKAPPEILENTPYAIELSFDNSTEDEVDKGKFHMAVYQNDGDYSILLVGG